MGNKIIKYSENFLTKLFNKIKSLFYKNTYENSQEIKETTQLQVKTTNNEEKQIFVKLVQAFDNNEISEKDLTPKEIELLTKYYENKNKELDTQIENQKRILESLNSKINSYYKKSVKLKAE